MKKFALIFALAAVVLGTSACVNLNGSGNNPYKALELSRILGTDIGSLAEEVLGIANAPYTTIDSFVSKARINNDGAYFEAGWLQ